MTTRMTSKTVTFQRPFVLTGFVRLQAAGAYVVDTEEELIDALTFPVWKRLSSVMQLSALGKTEHVNVDPYELHEALIRDGAQRLAHPPTPRASKRGRLSGGVSGLAVSAEER